MGRWWWQCQDERRQERSHHPRPRLRPAALPRPHRPGPPRRAGCVGGRRAAAVAAGPPYPWSVPRVPVQRGRCGRARRAVRWVRAAGRVRPRPAGRRSRHRTAAAGRTTRSLPSATSARYGCRRRPPLSPSSSPRTASRRCTGWACRTTDTCALRSPGRFRPGDPNGFPRGGIGAGSSDVPHRYRPRGTRCPVRWWPGRCCRCGDVTRAVGSGQPRGRLLPPLRRAAAGRAWPASRRREECPRRSTCPVGAAR